MKQKPPSKVVVTQDAESPVAVEVIAGSIKSIADGVRKLRAGPLNDRALLLLIRHAAPPFGRHNQEHLTNATVKAVLAGIDNLEREYLKTNKNVK